MPRIRHFSVVTYTPFGVACTVSGSDTITYASQMTDPTGLIYLSARYYDPYTGRFLELDPLMGHLSDPQTLDRYVYCANNPLIHTDPKGRDPWLGVAGFVGGFLAGVTVSLITQAASGKNIDIGTVLATGLGYGITGGLIGLTDGVSLTSDLAADGALLTYVGASGALGGAIMDVCEQKSPSVESMCEDAMCSIVSFGLFDGAMPTGGSEGSTDYVRAGLEEYGQDTSTGLTTALCSSNNLICHMKSTDHINVDPKSYATYTNVPIT